ncbi:MAG TPA: glycosyltransferase [Stellaceae bacterium]|nr:glycosyltransferase [Stellaceae bacterium]
MLLGLIVVAIWAGLLAFRGGFWRVERGSAPALAVAGRSVVAVIPARDEAGFIGGAVGSLLAQDYPGELHVVVVDDNSSDGTASVARAAGAPGRVTVVAGKAMPPGWTGKLWALDQGIAAAARMQPDYLLLTDADIVHAPGNVRDLVARAESEGYDLVSLMVRLHCKGFWERLLVPAFVFFFFKLYPPRWVAAPSRATAAAAGGCILLRRGVLDRIGGLASIRHEIIDDCALARRVKSGGKIWLGLGDTAQSVRPYGGWRPLWDMIARSAFAQLGFSAALLGAATAMMALTYLAPLFLALGPVDIAAKALGIAAWVAMSAAFVPMLWFYACPLWLAPLLPLIAAFYMAATCASAVQFWRGRGGAWKGRFQAAPPLTRPETPRETPGAGG